MDGKEISVIVPTYNRVNLLKDALSSVWAQTFANYEVVVVDDGSTDGTKEYLISLGDRIKFLPQPRRGPSAARNAGVKLAKGKYLAFLDSDDIWFPWTLAVFHQSFELHHPSLLCGASIEFQKSVPSHIKQTSVSAEYFSDYLESASDPKFIGTCTLAVKRSVFNRVGGFEESMRLAEDHDFLLRAATQRGFLRIRSPITVGYRRHIGNMSTSVDELAAAANVLLDGELQNRYPGQKARKMQRWKLLSQVLRPIVFSLLNSREHYKAWRLYRRCLYINVRLLRFRFLAGFVFYSALSVVSSGRSPLARVLRVKPE
jgi:glycosyltransferase involved in cell wall biosynthesis